MGRFVNGDEAKSILPTYYNSKNTFAYCSCNLINSFDFLGKEAVSISLGALLAIVGMCLVVVFGLGYCLDKNFRDSVNSLIMSVISAISSALGYLITVISEAVTTSINSRKYSGKEDHHIVARKDPRAILSRVVLYCSGLDTNYYLNIVPISKTLHKHLHTNSYFAAIDYIMISSTSLCKTEEEMASVVSVVLYLIGHLLTLASTSI